MSWGIISDGETFGHDINWMNLIPKTSQCLGISLAVMILGTLERYTPEHFILCNVKKKHFRARVHRTLLSHTDVQKLPYHLFRII
jgi:hypothetical protein